MARARRLATAGGPGAGAVPTAGGERQTTIFERLDSLTRRAGTRDPSAPATALFLIVLALMGLGLLIQASHASTTFAPDEFFQILRSQTAFRVAGLIVLLAARLGPSGVRRQVPAATVISMLLLLAVFAPPTRHMINGSNRWLDLGVMVFQPSELARIVLILWVADRCVRLGPLVRDARQGVIPMLSVALFFFVLIASETDIGGAMLLLLCVFATMWVGGARPTHVIGTFTTIAASALCIGFTVIPYVRARIESFFGDQTNQQITDGLAAMQSGGALGMGLGQGVYRNLGVPYLESDLVFAQVGEELGLVGMLLVLGLFAAFLWQAMRLVLSIRDRFDALASFGLLVATALQAMLHVQVVAGLAPPKGMTLPFVSHGGTSLVVSCLGVGLALGAARRSVKEVPR